MKMLDQETQLKLQAYLDGELSAGDIARVEALLARDPEAQALLAELKNTAAALEGHETGITVPESRDFYWSRIRREIERLEAAPAPAESKGSLLAMWKRYLVPAGGVLAALLVLALILSGGGNDGADGSLAKNDSTSGTQAETSVAAVNAVDEAEVFTFEDQKEGMVVVWLSYDTGH